MNLHGAQRRTADVEAQRLEQEQEAQPLQGRRPGLGALEGLMATNLGGR